jgi:hypothetical protein
MSFEAIPFSGVTSKERFPVIRQPFKTKRGPDPKRRLRGFVIAFHGVQVRVGFVEDGKVIQYMLPAKNLHRAGITAINQPFEMDEIEETGEGEYSLTYRFRPMTKADSATTDILDIDDELAELRDAALQHFGGAVGG